MPGVRYGPDIADDAAAIYTGLVDLGAKEKSIKAKSKAAKKAGKVKPGGLNKKDKAKYDRLAKLANDIFGVSKSDLKKGNYGDLYKMQRYSMGGKTKKGAPSKGAKYAKDKRTGKLRKRSETTEYFKRDPKGKTTRSQDRSGKTNETYLGLTKPKAYREIEERAYTRMNKPKRGGSGVTVGKKRVKVPDRAALDRLGIARSRGIEVTAARNKTTRNMRPPVVKKAKKPKAAASAKRAKGAQAKTAKTIKRGTGKTKPGTRKKK